MIYAGLYGLQTKPDMPDAANINLYKADPVTLAKFRKLPEDLNSACKIAAESEFIKAYVPAPVLDIYCKQSN